MASEYISEISEAFRLTNFEAWVHTISCDNRNYKMYFVTVLCCDTLWFIMLVWSLQRSPWTLLAFQHLPVCNHLIWFWYYISTTVNKVTLNKLYTIWRLIFDILRNKKQVYFWSVGKTLLANGSLLTLPAHVPGHAGGGWESDEDTPKEVVPELQKSSSTNSGSIVSVDSLEK
jgi:hypothetical protein